MANAEVTVSIQGWAMKVLGAQGAGGTLKGGCRGLKGISVFIAARHTHACQGLGL